MTQESNALLRCIKGWKRTRLGPFRAFYFELSGQTCLLVTSGMGIHRARQAARTLIETNSLHCLVSFGIAGAVEADLEVGDVVMVESVCSLEHGQPGPLLPLRHWPGSAREAATQALSGYGARLFTGTAVTTPGTQVAEDQLKGIDHPVLEMETAGIAQAAAEKGIPLLSLRAISDGPRAPIPVDLSGIMDENANLQAGRLLKAVVRHPGIILRSGQMTRNTRLAADNAAIALGAALSRIP